MFAVFQVLNDLFQPLGSWVRNEIRRLAQALQPLVKGKGRFWVHVADGSPGFHAVGRGHAFAVFILYGRAGFHAEEFMKPILSKIPFQG